MLRRDFVVGSSAGIISGLAACNTRPGTPAPGNPLAITDVSAFDSDRGVMQSAQTVIARDGTIEWVGPAEAAQIPPSAVVVHARGKFLIPGLIDAHVHLTHILYQARMTGDEILPFFLAHGVTAVRSTGDNVPAQRLVQRYADQNPGISPRIFMASFLIGRSPPHHPDVGWSLNSTDEVPAFVKHMADWGVRTLKLYINCIPAVGRRVIEEGHARGLSVAGHLTSYHPGDAVADGLDSLEHIYTVADFIRRDPDDRHSVDIHSDEAKRLIETIAQHEAYVDPTLMVFWGTLFFVDDPEVVNHPDNAIMPRRLLEYWHTDNPRRLDSFSAGPLEVRRRTYDTYMQLVGMLHEAGIPILVGTDAPEPQVPPGSSMHHEMEFLVQSGLSPAAVLSAATLENARVLKEETRLGAIKPGKIADMVLLNADPLRDIRNTRRIDRVIKGGILLDPNAILEHAPRD